MTDGQFLLPGRLDAPQLTANVNNWAPTGIGTSTVVYVDADAERSITGINAEFVTGQGAKGKRILILVNDGATHAINLEGEDAASTARNRFGWTGTFTLQPGDAVWLIYDGTGLRWRGAARSGVGGSGGTPGGSDTQLQYNDGGSFGGSTAMEFDSANSQLVVTHLGVAGKLSVHGDLTHTIASGTNNNYSAGGGLVNSGVLRLNPTTGDSIITGMAAPSAPYADGRLLFVYNAHASNKVTFLDNSGSSSAGNKIRTGSNFALTQHQGALFLYDTVGDGTDGFWRVVGLTGQVAHTHADSTAGGQLSATTTFNTGTMPTARLGSGTADARAVLRGDQTYGPQSQLCIAFNATGAANLTDTDQPAAAQFLRNSTRFVVVADLTPYTQARLVVNKQATAGASGAKIALKYATATPFTLGSYSSIANSGAVEVATNVTDQILDTGWVAMASGALIGSAYLALETSGGDGALDPQFGLIQAFFRA